MRSISAHASATIWPIHVTRYNTIKHDTIPHVCANRVFEELADYRAFELLRNGTMRGDYLLTKQVGS